LAQEEIKKAIDVIKDYRPIEDKNIEELFDETYKYCKCCFPKRKTK